MTKKNRYALVGAGIRSTMFTEALVDTYRQTCQLVGLCDVNRGRMELCNRQLSEKGYDLLPMYAAEAFDQMVAENSPFLANLAGRQFFAGNDPANGLF